MRFRLNVVLGDFLFNKTEITLNTISYDWDVEHLLTLIIWLRFVSGVYVYCGNLQGLSAKSGNVMWRDVDRLMTSCTKRLPNMEIIKHRMLVKNFENGDV